MPHTTRRSLALHRARYTGETILQARAGVSRGPLSHGLDHCTAEQRALRSLIALGVFNHGSPSATPHMWRASRLTVYGFHLSPRYDDLVIFSDAPENVARCFVTWNNEPPTFPGWRAACVHDHIRLVHLPTRARLSIEYGRGADRRRAHCAVPCSGSRHNEYASIGRPLTQAESTELGAVPPMSDDAAALLAGLVTRMTLTAADRSWATGGWASCPPDITSSSPVIPEASRMLWGSHDHWTLRWSGFPDAEFVTAALTDAGIGLAGAASHDDGRTITITYGTAVLTLEESYRSSPRLPRRRTST